MENASNALIMAGGVLIGVLILSLAAYLIITFGAQSREMHEQIEANQLYQYNAQYTVYEGREDVTIHEIVSVAHMAKEHNTNSQYDHVTVKLQGMAITNQNDLQNMNQNTEQYLLNVCGIDEVGAGNVDDDNYLLPMLFKCTNVQFYSNGKVQSITFKKI